MELSAEQVQVVEHDRGPARVTGRAGTGKTTALVARYRRLAGAGDPSRVLVLCRDRRAALAFTATVAPGLGGAYDALPITTFRGLAFDVLARHGRRSRPRLLTRAEQRALVRELLAAEGAAEWPSLSPLLHRPSFANELADAILAYEAGSETDGSGTAGSGPAQLRTRAGARGVLARWDELAAFAARYQAVLTARGATDGAALLAEASQALLDPHAQAAERERYDHVLVDDFEAATHATDCLLARLVEPRLDIVIAGNLDAAIGARDGASPTYLQDLHHRWPELAELSLTVPFRRPRPAVLVCCRHPSLEPEAIAAELLSAHEDGVPWSDMAVLVRRPRRRAQTIARALARYRIPVAAVPGPVGAEPTVRAILDLLRWVEGDATAIDRLLASPLSGLAPDEARRVRREASETDTALKTHPRLAPLLALRDEVATMAASADPAALAFVVWERALAVLADDPGSDNVLDALATFFDTASRWVEQHPRGTLRAYLAAADATASVATGGARRRDVLDTVTITSMAAAAGREWDTVVLAGCVEGEIPQLRTHVGFFDADLLGPADPSPLADRRRRALAEERRLFDEVACRRSTGRLVATAAPEPGVLLSRLVEGWPRRDPVLPGLPGPGWRPRPPTVGAAMASPGAGLRLSASQLDTYEDCPLRYAYTYVLGGDAGPAADVGSLVHRVLAEFCDPAQARGTWDDLVALVEIQDFGHLARYEPQREEARRDILEMLGRWWEEEGQGPAAPEVLAVEHHFDVEVGPHRLAGSIDRVDQLRSADGRPVGIRIVDYKTGKREPAALDMADHLQLAVYHLAATQDPALTEHGPVVQLELLFLRSMNRYRQEVRPDHGERTRGRVLAMADAITSAAFAPSTEADCDHCSFHRLCPLQLRGRQAGHGWVTTT